MRERSALRPSFGERSRPTKYWWRGAAATYLAACPLRYNGTLAKRSFMEVSWRNTSTSPPTYKYSRVHTFSSSPLLSFCALNHKSLWGLQISQRNVHCSVVTEGGEKGSEKRKGERGREKGACRTSTEREKGDLCHRLRGGEACVKSKL